MVAGYRLIEGLIYFFNPKAERQLIVKLSQKESHYYLVSTYLVEISLIAMILSFFFFSAFMTLPLTVTTILAGIAKQQYRTYLRLKYNMFQSFLRKYYRLIFKKELNVKYERIIVIVYSSLISIVVVFGFLSFILSLKNL